MRDTPPLHTIGHSTRTLTEFVDLLQVGNAGMVVDIRTVPRSRTNPQFNPDVLAPELARSQIGYTHLRELGGLRSRSRTVPAAVNGFWINESFHNYADYALSEEFQLGLTQLLALSEDVRCAIMCSEAVWWRCHRRIVADYLLHRGRRVFHLMGHARAEPAVLTEAARAQGELLVYPAIRET